MPASQRITPCLWFDDQAEAAAQFYVDIFRDSKITKVARYGKAGFEIHGRPAGSVMTVSFELDGQPFTALNGGPMFKFNEAISLQVFCETQKEVDRYWDMLSEGGDPNAQQCGWLKDKFGVSWQINPTVLAELMSDPNPEKSERVMEALLSMKKFDIAELKRASGSGGGGSTMKKGTRKSTAAKASPNGDGQVAAYAEALSPPFRTICDELRGLIDTALPKASSKVWHGSPVWFIGENPVVGYTATAKSVNLLFWNGKSFKEPAFKPVGKYGAAQAVFRDAAELDAKVIRGWLKKAKSDVFDSKAFFAKLRKKK